RDARRVRADRRLQFSLGLGHRPCGRTGRGGYAFRVSMTTKILIVEDDADSAEFLRIMLEGEGYLVRPAATAQHALAELSTWKPEIILMDLMLPDVEGMDLLNDFRRISPA